LRRIARVLGHVALWPLASPLACCGRDWPGPPSRLPENVGAAKAKSAALGSGCQ
jgi:hypothetical protein